MSCPVVRTKDDHQLAMSECRESREATEQLQHVIGTGIDQRLVVLTRSLQNQTTRDRVLRCWEIEM